MSRLRFAATWRGKAMSLPFSGKEFTFTNPDGTEVPVRGWGDQYYAVFETLDGFTVAEDPQTKYYQYATLTEDKNDLQCTGMNAGQGDPETLGLRPGIRIRREAAKGKAATAHDPRVSGRQCERRRQQKKQVRLRALQADPSIAPPADQTVGNYVGLCLLIQFPDVAGTISQQEVTNFCNLSGYGGFGNNGSVHDYFLDNSRGKLSYTNLVTAYYTAANNRSFYTDPNETYGSRTRQLIEEALDSLVAQGFDFSQLTTDENDYVYAMNVFYAGPVVNNWSQGLWPHAWSLATTYDAATGKKLYDYQITNMGNELTLGTFCHENGHMLCDFPDLYDYGYESYGPGNYTLMAFGGAAKNPVQVDAYLKNEAGWADSLTPITSIASGATASVSATNNDFYIYSKSATEYFIVENRQKQGRDTSLPDGGLTIWHIDETASNNNEQMTAAQHYECSLEQADNRFDMENKSNAGDGEDLFGNPYNTRFADDTSPNSNWWDGSSSGLVISEISAPGPIMTFKTADFAVVAEFDNAPVLALLLLDEEPDLTGAISLLLS